MDRRSFLGLGLSGAAGIAAGSTATLGVKTLTDRLAEGAVGSSTVPFRGPHQPGIAMRPQAHGTLLAFTLHDDVDADALQRLLRVWTADIELLMAGQPTMGDAAGPLAQTPASLTVTVGLGHGAFVRAGATRAWPYAVNRIPAYPIDRLEDGWSDGDLLLAIGADAATTVSHAARELMKDARPFAEVKWQQSGFMPPPDVNPGQTGRNLMGFLDGSRNPVVGTDEFDRVVWNDGSTAPWFAGGTAMAFRRIRINLDTWEQLDLAKQEAAFGRRLVDGAPLSGGNEFTNPDLDAKRAGEPLIPTDSHVRRSTTERRLYRRPFNYDDGFTADGTNDVGLLFVSYQADIDQFLEVQQRLAELDSLNTWTTPIGSALFVIPPGVTTADGWIGEGIFA